MSHLQETQETGRLNAMGTPELDPFTTKDVMGTHGESRVGLRIRQWDSIRVNVLRGWLYRGSWDDALACTPGAMSGRLATYSQMVQKKVLCTVFATFL